MRNGVGDVMASTAILIYLALINFIGLVMMLWDKSKAKRGVWRISEKTLLGTAVIGGSLGVFAGMRLFRHKTQHLQFWLGVPVIIFLQVAAAIYWSL